MASKGTFPDGDPSALVELVGKRILKGSVLTAMLGRIVGVHVWPAGVKFKHRGQVPHVRIGRPTLMHPNVSAALAVPGVDAPTVQYWLNAAGVTGAALTESWGNISAQFPDGVSAEFVVHWTISALKAVGASPAGGWAYEGEKPDSN